jgi:alpha-1,6-mannosyltransferase
MARIVQLANFVSPTSGGIRTALDALAEGYRAAGHEVIQVVPGPEERVEAHRVVLRGRRLPGQPYRVLTDLGRVRAVVERLQADRVEISDKTTLAWAGPWPAPTVLLSHERVGAMLRPRVPGAVPQRTLDAAAVALNRALAARVDAVVCASAYAAAEWHRVGTRPSVVPLGVDLERFHPSTGARRGLPGAGRPVGPVELVCVSRLSAEKRPERAIEVLARLREDGVAAALTMVGDGPRRARLERLARGLPVRFVGHLPGVEVATFLAVADVAVCPCPIESFGLAALEAMACGTPVAVPAGGALRELVDGGEVGCGAVDDDLVAAVRRCLATGDPRAARRRAEHLPWGATVQGMLHAHGLGEPSGEPSPQEEVRAS